MSDNDDLGVEVPDKLFFRIGEAAELVGVEPHVLRYWESEFRLRPQRSASGQRMYKRKDIAKFVRIRRLLHDEGFTIAGARRALSAESTQAPAADAGRIQEALQRIEAVRKRIRETRARFASPVASEPPSDD